MNKIEFYIDKFEYTSDYESLDFSFIPSILRRRLSPLNKATFYTIENCITDKVENIVYSSRYGEFDKLKKLIDSFSEENCVSPTVFSSSVHNATLGAYLHSNKLNKPYIALAAAQSTLSMGLLHTITNSYTTNLFCYSDYINEKPISIAMLISKEPIGRRFLVEIERTEKLDTLNEIDLLISLLKKEREVILFNNYKIGVL